MDIFDQYMFEELVSEYNRTNLSDDDYEELYIRFCNLSHLEEVKPYLFVMRFLGLGTSAEPDVVLNELKAIMMGNVELMGLYNDLLLFENSYNPTAITNLRILVEEGYTNKYTKERSHIEQASNSNPIPESNQEPPQTDLNEEVIVDHMTFESNGYCGLYLTSEDIDYLSANIFIKPIRGKRSITVKSQIFLNNKPFSDVFSSEYDIDSKINCLKTLGWGNSNHNCYSENTYRWVVDLGGSQTFYQEFNVSNGKIDKKGVRIKAVNLFASKESGDIQRDMYNYKTQFDSKTLEYLYFNCSIDHPGTDKIIKMSAKIIYLEDESVITDTYFLIKLNSYTHTCYAGDGFSIPGQWKKGLYKYSVSIGNYPAHEGTFTVY